MTSKFSEIVKLAGNHKQVLLTLMVASDILI